MKRIITIFYKLTRSGGERSGRLNRKIILIPLIAVIVFGALAYLLTSVKFSEVRPYANPSDTVSTAITPMAPGNEGHDDEIQSDKQIPQSNESVTQQNPIVETTVQSQVCSKCGGSGNFEFHSTCNTCNGSGVFRCDDCKGNGYIICYSCSGRATFQCNQCNGKGINYCPTCGGRGRFYNGLTGKTETCYACNGEKSSECSYCRGTGKNSCAKCNGTGKMVCFECNQTGQIACTKCLGKKVIIQTSVCDKCSGTGAVTGL